MILIIKGFRTIVFIFIVISTTFRPICPPVFFRCLSNSGTFTELRTTSFIESTGVACSDSVSHNRVQVLSIPILFLACSQDWICNIQVPSWLQASNNTWIEIFYRFIQHKQFFYIMGIVFINPYWAFSTNERNSWITSWIICCLLLTTRSTNSRSVEILRC